MLSRWNKFQPWLVVGELQELDASLGALRSLTLLAWPVAGKLPVAGGSAGKTTVILGVDKKFSPKL